MGKLSEHHEMIVEAWLGGEKQTAIAKRFGATQGSINQILQKYCKMIWYSSAQKLLRERL